MKVEANEDTRILPGKGACYVFEGEGKTAADFANVDNLHWKNQTPGGGRALKEGVHTTRHVGRQPGKVEGKVVIHSSQKRLIYHVQGKEEVFIVHYLGDYVPIRPASDKKLARP